MCAVAGLVLEVRRLKGGKLVVLGRPEEGEGLVVFVEGGVEGRQAVIMPQDAVLLRKTEFLLPLEVPCDQPEVGREEAAGCRLQGTEEACRVQVHRQGVAGGAIFEK